MSSTAIPGILGEKYPFSLPKLPFDIDALEPFVSGNTMSYHHGKHHKTYVDKLNSLLEGDFSSYKDSTLLEIVLATSGKPGESAVFNNASQIYCHDFFWHSLAPGGSTSLTSAAKEVISKSFGDKESMFKVISAGGLGQFGSGWVWVVQNQSDKKLSIVKTPNAENPLTTEGVTPICVIDVWEHAYYLDYQNRRPDFIESICLNVLNLDFISQNIKV